MSINESIQLLHATAATPSTYAPHIHNNNNNNGKKIRSSQTALFELLEGAALYVFCIAISTLFGILVKYHENYHHPNCDSWITEYYDYYFQNVNTIASSSYHILCHDADATTTTSSYIQTTFCNLLAGITTTRTTTEPQDQPQRYMTDMQLVLILSLLLALIRIIIFHFLVPEFLAPQQFKAIMRCKSSHVLSSDSLQNFVTVGTTRKNNDRKKKNSSLFSLHRFFTSANRSLVYAGSTITSSSSLAPISLKTSTSTTAPREEYEDDDDDDATTTTTPITSSSLFSGPRYATSIFRLLFFTVTTMYAWLAFHSAEFWPIYLGGLRGGRTRYCWNLSGNVNYTSFDSDFDSKNELLRYYFIFQASYHLQSICFQILSLGVLLTTQNEKFVSMRSGMKNYFRPFTEHILATVIIASAFLFSGLRRLGAVGMYTMDLSGLFLQLLHICLNAPPEQRISQPKVIHAVHSYMVVPVFLYCRMFVFPFVVLYSVAFESKEWFRQLENVLPIAGCGRILYLSFCSVVFLIQLLNIIYLRRLLYHPHVVRLKT